MSNPANRNPGLGASVAAAGCAMLVFAAVVRDWLTVPEFAAQLWPTDINRTVVQWLGGSTERNVLEVDVVTVGVESIWLRLFVIVAMLWAIQSFTCRSLSATARKSQARSALWASATVCAVSSLWWLFWMIGHQWLPALENLCVSALALWATITAAILSWVWIFRRLPQNATGALNQNQHSAAAKTTLLLAVFCWMSISYWLNYRLYCQVLIPHGDSAMYEEHLWNIWHGKGFRSYLDQGLFLGEHIQMIHLLILPLHLLWPSHLLLELVESFALASCAIPIYLITKRHTQHPWSAAMLGIAWLFYFPMHFLDIAIDQKTFRPIALGLPFLFWLIEFAEQKKMVRAFICLLLALSAKEDMALITFPLLAVLAFRAHDEQQHTKAEYANARPPWMTLAAMSLFSIVYLGLVVLVVIPMFRSGDHVHYSRYFGDLGRTPGELIKTAVTEPVRVLEQAVTVRTAIYVCQFLGPLAFIAVRKPLILASGTLTFGMLSLLEFGGDDSLPPVPYHHFHAPLLPVLFWAAVVSTGKDRNQDASAFDEAGHQPQARAGLVLLCCVFTAITGSLMPCGATFWSGESQFGGTRLYLPSEASERREQAALEVVKQIPADSRVASTDFIHTRLTHCERSYDYSDYLRRVNNYQPGVPADTDYIVIDTGHRYSKHRNASTIPELNQRPAVWEQLPDTTNGEFVILRKIEDPDSSNNRMSIESANAR